MQRFTVIPAVYIVFHRGHEVLLIRRANTGYMDGWYSLPSGHLDGGEPAHLAAIREAKEEVGVTIRPQDLEFLSVTHRVAEEGNHERIDFCFLATNWQGEPHNAEPHKCDDIRWVNLTSLPDNTIPLVRKMLTAIESGDRYLFENFEQES
jgi:8-oxo-dGTP diphosphatase